MKLMVRCSLKENNRQPERNAVVAGRKEHQQFFFLQGEPVRMCTWLLEAKTCAAGRETTQMGNGKHISAIVEILRGK